MIIYRAMRTAWAYLLATALGAGAVPGVMPGAPALAQAIVSTGESFVTARLAVGPRSGDGLREAGLVLDIAKGWKTYWRNPGEAGIPPAFDWSGSRNVADIEIDWPRPTSFESFGMRTLGYARQVVLPLRIHPVDPAAPVGLDLRVALGVCSDICILEETRVQREIPAGAEGEDAALIAAARATVPGPGAGQGLVSAVCRVTGTGTDRGFTARLVFDKALADPTIVLEGPADSWFHGTEIASDGAEIAVSSQLSLVDPAAWIERGDLRISVFAGDVAADIRGCTAPAG
ncbi:protein-disulfide reductase DsbD domain-containing protein [Thermohalobaculum sediminis]|uniref:protein-disulfide reductase DsbD domain-containing protein n=1 Tax=Thermohalobaculum sediminis TaxID=2939436 RepID=UPI0020BF02F1|nr:protein-disulfide reductase DsbD domain-containing protein [Limibaculum sediminis]